MITINIISIIQKIKMTDNLILWELQKIHGALT